MDLRHWQDDPNTRTVLEERARLLARQEEAERHTVGEEVLIFRLGEAGYSMPVQAVREVTQLRACTPLPVMPAHIVGLVNLRGRLLSVLDIRPLLGIPRTAPRPESGLLRVALGEVEVGLLIDEVVEVRRDDGGSAPALSALAGQSVAWVRGVDRQLNLLIDPALLLSDPRLQNGEGER
ncbi:MAG TPA: chemotaxis protein CheW [Roseiflexaceae bacterium]|nr:chemotaxis protein CheW [Roseiflexaceae bacterium]